MADYGYISKNYLALTEEIARLSAGKQTVTLVAVTKSGSDEELLALVRAGAGHIGENRPQELRRRADLIRAAGLEAELHEIGNLQKNKVRLIAPDVSLIHSVDSLALAEEIDRRASALGRVIPVLIEVNSAGEEAKGGVAPEECESLIESVSRLNNVRVAGLMTMGPVVEDPELIRPYFALTKALFDRMNARFGFENGGILSMGMSDSYRVAIEEGATLVRVGRRLFVKDEEQDI